MVNGRHGGAQPMFSKKQSGQNGNTETGEAKEDAPRLPKTSTPRPAEDLLARRPRPDIPRTPAAPAAASAASEPRAPAHKDETAKEEQSRLLVGEGIKLKGEITNCAELVIEGAVDARVEARRFQVSNNGTFSGECNVEEADIAGQFDGTLNCRGKLIVRSTGKLKGTLRYGDVEIEGGGRVAGEIQEFGAEESRKPVEQPQLKAAGE